MVLCVEKSCIEHAANQEHHLVGWKGTTNGSWAAILSSTVESAPLETWVLFCLSHMVSVSLVFIVPASRVTELEIQLESTSHQQSAQITSECWCDTVCPLQHDSTLLTFLGCSPLQHEADDILSYSMFMLSRVNCRGSCCVVLYMFWYWKDLDLHLCVWELFASSLCDIFLIASRAV